MPEMLRRWMWRVFANITLGIWLLASPATRGYRSTAMVWSDVVNGGFIAGFGILTLFPRFNLARWAICLVGVWLLFAPLLFWTPGAAAYATDALIGALVIAFSVLIPMMPSRAHHEVMMGPGPDTPPGWSYNPSDWMQRGARSLPWHSWGSSSRPSGGVSTLLNVLMGLGVVAGPWLLAGDTEWSRWNDVIVGVAVMVLSIRRGGIQERFGEWNRSLVLVTS